VPLATRHGLLLMGGELEFLRVATFVTSEVAAVASAGTLTDIDLLVLNADEAAAFAGGNDVLGEPGARSHELTLADVAAADPDIIVLMPCGFDAERAVAESHALAADPLWDGLRAVRDGRVFAVDGNAYFSRPGPRVADGIELLASLFHPDRTAAPKGARAIRLPTTPLASSSRA